MTTVTAPSFTDLSYEDFVGMLGEVKKHGSYVMAHCPAHDDRTASTNPRRDVTIRKTRRSVAMTP